MGVRTWRGRAYAFVSGAVVALAVVMLPGCRAERPAATPPTMEEPEEVEVAPPPGGGDEVALSGRCELPPSSSGNCWKSEPELLDVLEQSMTAATVAHPEYFDFDSLRCGNCYHVTNVDGYYAELARQLQLRGVCSVQDRDEITLKLSNGWSEQFDILLADDHIRRGAGSYLYSCSPAMF